MNKTIKNLNYSKSKNRSKKLLKGGSPTIVSEEEKAQSAPAILKPSAQKKPATAETKSAPQMPSFKQHLSNMKKRKEEKKKAEKLAKIEKLKTGFKFRPGSSTEVVDSIEKRLNFFSKSKFDFLDLEEIVFSFYDETYTSPEYNHLIEKERVYSNRGVEDSRIERWKYYGRNIKSFMEDNFLNLYNDLNALSPEEFFDNSYIAFNDLHGCITNEYNIVPSNTIVCFMSPIDNTVAYDYNNEITQKLSFLNKMYDLSVQEYKDLFYSRDKINQNDSCLFAFKTVLYSCFKNCMWFYPGQIYPDLGLSLNYEELDNTKYDGPCYQFQYFDIEKTPEGEHKVVGKDIHRVPSDYTPINFNSREEYKIMAAKKREREFKDTGKVGKLFFDDRGIAGYLSTFVNISRPDKKFKLVIAGNCRLPDGTLETYNLFELNLKLELYIYHLNKSFSKKYTLEGNALISTLCSYKTYKTYLLKSSNLKILLGRRKKYDDNLSPVVPHLMEMYDKLKTSYELTKKDILYIFSLSPKKILLFLIKIRTDYPEKFKKIIEKITNDILLSRNLSVILGNIFKLGKRNIIKSLGSKYRKTKEEIFQNNIILSITDLIFQEMTQENIHFKKLLKEVKKFRNTPKNQITIYREVTDEDYLPDLDMHGVKIILYEAEIITDLINPILNVEDETQAPTDIIFNKNINLNLQIPYPYIKELTFNECLEFTGVENHNTLSQLFTVFPSLIKLTIRNYNLGSIIQEFTENGTIEELEFINCDYYIKTHVFYDEELGDFVQNDDDESTTGLDYMIDNLIELTKITFTNCLKVPQYYPDYAFLNTLIIENITSEEINTINIGKQSQIKTLNISYTEFQLVLIINNVLENLILHELYEVKIESPINVEKKLEITNCNFHLNSAKKFIPLSSYTFENLKSLTMTDIYKIDSVNIKGKMRLLGMLELKKFLNLKYFLALGFLKILDKYIAGKRKKKRIQVLEESSATVEVLEKSEFAI